VIAFFVAYLLLGFLIFKDYGVAWDEPGQIKIGKVNYEYVVGMNKNLLSDPDRYHGPVFELILLLITKTGNLETLPKIYYTRHLVNFILFFIAVWFYFLILFKRWGSWKWGLLGCFFLIVSPRIFAEAFYNSKDLPFLSVFVIAIYTLMRFLDLKTWREAAIHAVVCSLLIGIRIPGIILPVITIAFLFVDVFLNRDTLRVGYAKSIGLGLTYLGLTAVLIILVYPAFWKEPIYNYIQAFIQLSHYPWDADVLYLGRYISNDELPWHYISVWIAITTPVVYLLGFLIGLARMSGELLKNGILRITRAKRNDLIALTWFFAPLLIVIFNKSVLYDSWRRLYFIYPGFLWITVHGLRAAYHILIRFRLPTRVAQVTFLVITLLMLLPPLQFMINNHPYQNLYFNRLAGENMDVVKQRFELDYWGLSYRQALAFIVDHDPSSSIRIKYQNYPGWTNSLILPLIDQKRLHFVNKMEEAQYFVGDYRWHKEEFSYANEIFSVKIGGTRIMVVYKLR
jgi:hypothetical protein